MRQDVLDQILNRYVNYVTRVGLEGSPAEPASGFDLHQVHLEAREKLGVVLDPAYLYLSGIIDGIGVSGSRLFATKRRHLEVQEPEVITCSEGIIQENMDYRRYGVGSSDAASNPNTWLVYGIADAAFMIQHLPSKRFQMRPRDYTSHAVCDFPTLEELVWEAFRYSLKLDEFPTE